MEEQWRDDATRKDEYLVWSTTVGKDRFPRTARSRPMSIAANTNTSSHNKTCASEKHIPKSSATRPAKFSKPLQRRTLEGGKNCGILRVCERKVNELRGPLAVLVAQRGKSCGLRNEPPIH